ncbi:hypothetical protein QYF36_003139 [Acer negundo]|nr:hypothetical protein QYF36_003139 [Acer negundo]
MEMQMDRIPFKGPPRTPSNGAMMLCGTSASDASECHTSHFGTMCRSLYDSPSRASDNDREKTETGITVVTLCPHHWPVRGLSRFGSFYHQPASSFYEAQAGSILLLRVSAVGNCNWNEHRSSSLPFRDRGVNPNEEARRAPTCHSRSLASGRLFSIYLIFLRGALFLLLVSDPPCLGTGYAYSAAGTGAGAYKGAVSTPATSAAAGPDLARERKDSCNEHQMPGLTLRHSERSPIKTMRKPVASL